MADGAWEITKAVNEVFGNNTVKRLMCKSHMFTAYKTKLKKIRKVDNELAKEIEEDIFDLQWMVSGTVEFCYVFKLLEEKFLCENYRGEKLDLIKEFFQYFRNIWGPETHIAN